MPGNDIIKSFLKQEIKSCPQSIEQLNGRCVGPISPHLVELQVVLPIEEHSHRFGALGCLDRLGAGAHDPNPGGEGERLLGPGEGHVHAPFVHAEVEGADGGHAIHQEEGRVVVLVEDLPDRGEVVGDTRGRLVVDDADGLDGVGPVFGQLGGQGVQIGALAPLALDHVHVEVEALLLVDPQEAELPNQERNDPVARGERVR